MSTLTPAGRRLVDELGPRHGFGPEATAEALRAVAAGGGRMAQFSHPELGGSGQWMAGGMLMLGDTSDHALKARVGALCDDLSKALASAGPLVESSRSRGQGQVQGDGPTGGAASTGSPRFAASAADAWWPEDLGTPSATGSQDSTRYAYFADARRLALAVDGKVRVHDTLDHRITGFSQQRGGAGGMTMSSRRGTVDPATLPLVSGDASDAKPAAGSGDVGVPATAAPAAARGDDPLQLIEKLGRLRERGLLSDEEFAAKKRELLARV